MAINLINKIKVFVNTHLKYESKFTKNKIEATKFLKEQLDKIHFVRCVFNSNHGINLSFTLNVNKVDLSKNSSDEFYFYDKEGYLLMYYNKKSNDFWLSYIKIWEKLKEKFGPNYLEIANFTKPILKKHFKCNVITPTTTGYSLAT